MSDMLIYNDWLIVKKNRLVEASTYYLGLDDHTVHNRILYSHRDLISMHTRAPF